MRNSTLSVYQMSSWKYKFKTFRNTRMYYIVQSQCTSVEKVCVQRRVIRSVRLTLLAFFFLLFIVLFDNTVFLFLLHVFILRNSLHVVTPRFRCSHREFNYPMLCFPLCFTGSSPS